MNELKRLFTSDFLINGGYSNMFMNLFLSIIKPLVLLIKYLFKYFYVMLLPILPIKNKNYDRFYTQKERERQARRKQLENNFIRVYKS
ncbi:hypothetical protein BU002_02285 [Mammaliicoccus sciuri]|uniref:hypothetical protein n=1 Tax=Mammaliicoccus sciuri TaxID=1296 RepID=UPI000E684CF8|nr:hypothetical protein [Mammaliicoccus sciuri]RIN97169.1 hypothetical protein BU002_02285 [Mammaliicoccus sciuri]